MAVVLMQKPPRGAIGMVNGKAKLMRDDCATALEIVLRPTSAISLVSELPPMTKRQWRSKKRLGKPVFHGCPGSMMKTFAKKPAR